MYCQFFTIILFSIVLLSMHRALEHNYALVNNALYKCCINKLVQSLLDYDHNFLLKCD